MAGQPAKQVSLFLVGCQIADPSAFGRILPKFFNLHQIVLHHDSTAALDERTSVATHSFERPSRLASPCEVAVHAQNQV